MIDLKNIHALLTFFIAIHLPSVWRFLRKRERRSRKKANSHNIFPFYSKSPNSIRLWRRMVLCFIDTEKLTRADLGSGRKTCLMLPNTIHACICTTCISKALQHGVCYLLNEKIKFDNYTYAG